MSQKGKSGLGFLMAGLMIGSVLTGCETNTADYSSTVVAKYGDEKIYMDEAYFYAKLTQYQYEMNYSTSLWSYDFTGSGETFEDSVREDVMSQILQTYILNEEAAEKGITLSEEQKALVKENVEKFMEDEKVVAATKATESLVERIYTMNAIANLMYEDLVADTSTDVEEENFLCKNISYILIRSTDTDEAENVDKEAIADEILEKVNEGKKFEDIVGDYKSDDYSVSKSENVTIQKSSTYLFQEEAWAMKTDEVIKTHVEDKDYWYVIKCNSDNDEDAQKNAIENEIEKRKAENFKEKYADILKEAKKFTVDEKKWAQIKFIDDPAYIPESTENSSNESSTGTEGSAEESAGTTESTGESGGSDESTSPAESTGAEESTGETK